MVSTSLIMLVFYLATISVQLLQLLLFKYLADKCTLTEILYRKLCVGQTVRLEDKICFVEY